MSMWAMRTRQMNTSLFMKNSEDFTAQEIREFSPVRVILNFAEGVIFR